MRNAVLPAIAAAVLLVSLAGVRLLPLAAALGLFAAYVWLKKWPALPTDWNAPNGIEWLLWSFAAAALIALLEHGRLLPDKLAAALGVAVAGTGAWLVLKKVAVNWSGEDVALHGIGSGLAVALLALGSRRLIQRAPAGLSVAILFTLVLSADAVLLALSNSVEFGLFCSAVAAATGAAVGTAIWRRPFALARADGTWLGIAHGLFLVLGAHVGTLPWQAAVLAAPAPLVPLLLRGNAAPKYPVGWALAAIVLVALPFAGAFWFVSGRGS